jgi:glycosyltransferase 2 family protein
MRLVINVSLSLAMLAVCLWLVWPGEAELDKLRSALHSLDLAAFAPYLLGYVALLAITHFCRGYRWNHLLRPIGAELSTPRLMAISSVGFMAILALPARLGEFVRPALIRRRGHVSASAALGTVAVERVIDGLLVSLFVFGAFVAIRGPDSPGWMMPTAYAALGVFAAASVFLGCALRWPHRTVHAAVRMTLTPRLAPKVAVVLDEKLHSLISGFLVLKDGRNLGLFTLWSLAYWIANGLGMYVLARGFGLDLSVMGAFATMGLVAVGITLPNSPGLVGQFQWFTVLGLMLFLPAEVARTDGLLYAIVLHAIQVVWYVGIGSLALASRHVSFAEVWASRRGVDELAGAPESTVTGEVR